MAAWQHGSMAAWQYGSMAAADICVSLLINIRYYTQANEAHVNETTGLTLTQYVHNKFGIVDIRRAHVCMVHTKRMHETSHL